MYDRPPPTFEASGFAGCVLLSAALVVCALAGFVVVWIIRHI